MKNFDSEAPIDKAYLEMATGDSELHHKYGKHVHILSDPFLLTHLAFLCEENTIQPAVNSVVCDLYKYLIKAVLNGEFPRAVRQFRTRMAKISEQGIWTGQIIKPETRTVTVNILRAGSLPSQVCFDFLNKTLDPNLTRQDHVVMARITDENEQVTGSYLGDSKIGGDIDGAYVLFPDPMGATGSSLSVVIDHYKRKISGTPQKIITVNLMVTPDYLRRMKRDHPDVIVYALRLDRGASPADVLNEIPGARWNEESGLTDKQYIIPGGGGFGEVMNNAYC